MDLVFLQYGTLLSLFCLLQRLLEHLLLILCVAFVQLHLAPASGTFKSQGGEKDANMHEH